jgi:hypothetical protein
MQSWLLTFASFFLISSISLFENFRHISTKEETNKVSASSWLSTDKDSGAKPI